MARTSQADNQKLAYDNAVVGGMVDVLDIRLTHVSADLNARSFKRPLTLRADASSALQPLGSSFIVYEVTYHVYATDNESTDVVTAKLVLELLFKYVDGADSGAITVEELTAFGSIGVIEIAHPYVREILFNLLTGRMGLPKLILDVKPPTYPRN